MESPVSAPISPAPALISVKAPRADFAASAIPDWNVAVLVCKSTDRTQTGCAMTHQRFLAHGRFEWFGTVASSPEATAPLSRRSQIGRHARQHAASFSRMVNLAPPCGALLA